MKKHLLITGIYLCVAALALAYPSEKTLHVILVTDQNPWTDSHLDSELQIRLTRQSDYRVFIHAPESAAVPTVPDDRYNSDSLLAWGREVGGDFLLLVDITSQRLEKRKSFHLPLVFHKYETVGVIEGHIRMIDVSRGKQLLAEPLQVEKKANEIFQATMDDDINDPDLHITAPEKARFFRLLETDLVDKLARKVSGYLGRNRN